MGHRHGAGGLEDQRLVFAQQRLVTHRHLTRRGGGKGGKGGKGRWGFGGAGVRVGGEGNKELLQKKAQMLALPPAKAGGFWITASALRLGILRSPLTCVVDTCGYPFRAELQDTNRKPFVQERTEASNASEEQVHSQRNPEPVYRLVLPVFIGFQPSQLVQDVVHPQ